MAIANADGSIVLSLKISTQKAFENFKGKIAQIAKEKKGLTILVEESKRLQAQLKQLEKEYALLLAQEQILGNDATLGIKMEKLQGSIETTKSLLKETQDAAIVLGKKSTKSFDDMSKGLKTLGKRIAGIVKSALIFSVLYRVMQSVVKLFQNILMSDEEFRQDWEELKAAFYTAAYPIINLIVPAIKFIVQQVRDWAVSIGKVAAALQGMSYSELVNQAKASKEAADNYADMEKSSKKTADNVKKQLAGFDDIQILSSGNEEEQGANGAGFEGLGQYDASGAKSMLGDIMNAIGGALMAIGLILLFHGQIAWGIGFIIAGAVGIAAATLTDESISQTVKDQLSNALIIVGIVAIVIGLLLCMSPAHIALGVGLIVIGVASIVAPIALNWDGIKEQLQGSFGGWLVLGGIIAIVLGILLCFNPATLPLGIGLIFLGAGSIVAPIVANWDAILGWLQKAWSAVKSFWDKYIAPVFTAKFWLDLAKACGNGLIAGFEGAINGIIGMFEMMINWIVDGLNKISIKVPNWVPGIGGKKFGFDIPKAKFGRASIPRLAQGTVLPGGKPFLAWVNDQPAGQTNIEAPLQTIVDAFNIALAQNGGAVGGGKTEVVLEVDGREFGRAVVEQGDRENRRIGTRLVIS